jgi:hypothetical protein
MRTRVSAQAIEISQTIDDLLLHPSKYEKAQEFGERHGYLLQRGTQNVVDVITWTGAYNQAMERETNHDAAVLEADSIVRLTQGSFAAEDVSAFEAGRSYVRAFTMFFGYFNMQANLLGTQFSVLAREMGLRKGAGRGLYIYVMGFMIPAVLSELLRRGVGGFWTEDDDDSFLSGVMDVFFGSQFRTLAAMVPIAGPIATSVVNRFNEKSYDDRISTSPAISLIEQAGRAPVSVYEAIVEKGRENRATRARQTKRAIRDTLTAIGMLSGLPALPLAKPAGYLSDVAYGVERPEGALDVARGLASGRSQ